MRALAALTALLLAACAARATPDPEPAPLHRELADARAAAAAGHHARADSLFELWGRLHPVSPDAADVPYWRALLHVDPDNRDGSRPLAAHLLDAYLERDTATYAMEARSLRALLRTVDSLERAAAPVPDTVVVVADTLQQLRDRERELERENARLRSELERATAELERIRRRLAEPPPR